MNSDVRFYLSIILKRLPIILLIVIVAAVGSAFVALTLPSMFRSSALLLVESAQIPGRLAESTVDDNAPEQLEIIEQRLLTRANLIDISNDIGVFDGQRIVPDEIVEEMRERTSFQASFGRDRATLLTISFEHSSPEVSARVVNEYVTRVLAESVEIRTSIAQETLDFFEQEIDRLSTDLATQGARILDFKNENLGALPESMDFRLNRQSTLSERRITLERERNSLGDQRDRLIQIFNATGQVGNNSAQPSNPLQAQLDGLQNDLNSALAIYSEQNPRVRVLRARIEELENRLALEVETTTDAPVPEVTGQAILDLQLAEIDSRLEFIEQQTDVIDTELADLESSIAQTPANTITLEALEREYANIQTQYNSASSRLAAAATGERIELTAKGQRISVLRQANIPREPTSPNRLLIMVLGIAGGIGAAGGLVFLLELINRTVRRPVDISNALGILPLATVPYIPTGGEVARRRGLALTVIGALVLGVPAGLYYVHVEYLPLDLLADRAIDRLGL